MFHSAQSFVGHFPAPWYGRNFPAGYRQILLASLRIRTLSAASRGPKALRGGFFSISYDRSPSHRFRLLRPTQILRHQMVSTTVLSLPTMTDLARTHKRPLRRWPQFFSRVIRTPVSSADLMKQG
jgi:hypothetical protein